MLRFSEIVNKIPYIDGGFRRRMTAGTIVTLTIGYSVFITGADNLDGASQYGYAFGTGFKQLADVLSSPAAAVLFFLLVNAVGGLVEVVAELFVAKFTSNIAWAVTEPRWNTRNKNKLIKWIVQYAKRISFSLAVPFRIYYGLAMALRGRSIYRWEDLRRELRTSTRADFKKYPGVVIDGLMEPFGKYGSVSWKYFADYGNTNSTKALARTLESRNRDILTIVSSLLTPTTLALVIFVEVIMRQLSHLPAVNSNPTFVYTLLLGALLLPLAMVVLLYSYFKLVRQSILTILECNSFRTEFSSTNKANDEAVPKVVSS